METFISAEAKHELQHGRVGRETLTVLHGID